MLLTEDTFRQLDAFSLAVREHTQGAAGGMRRARTMGASVEFSDFRQYAPGDDPRRVDWNAYARFEKLFLKLFLDEQETTLRVLIDASASMRYGEPDKWGQAQKLAAALAYLALSRYDRVMLVNLSNGGAVCSRPFSGFPRQAGNMLISPKIAPHTALTKRTTITTISEAIRRVTTTITVLSTEKIVGNIAAKNTGGIMWQNLRNTLSLNNTSSH